MSDSDVCPAVEAAVAEMSETNLELPPEPEAVEQESAARWHAVLRAGKVISEPTKIALKKALVETPTADILAVFRGSLVPLITKTVTTF